MYSKFSRLSLMLLINLLIGSSIAVAMNRSSVEEFAEEATRTSSAQFNHHSHNYIFTGNTNEGKDPESIQDIIHFGFKKGVLDGTSQVVAYAIVKLAFMGGEFLISPTLTKQKELLQQQQVEEMLMQLDKNLKRYLEEANKNSIMIGTLVDGAVKLDDPEAKKLALAALKKYAEQTHNVLDMQKHAFEQTKAMAQQLVNS